MITSKKGKTLNNNFQICSIISHATNYLIWNDIILQEITLLNDQMVFIIWLD